MLETRQDRKPNSHEDLRNSEKPVGHELIPTTGDEEGRAAVRSFEQLTPGSSSREEDLRDRRSVEKVGNLPECEVPKESDEIRLSEATEDEGHSREVNDINGRDSPGLDTKAETS